MRTTLALCTLAFALASAGCIQNMQDLRDRVGGDENLTPAATELPAETSTTNTTLPTNATAQRPPVARISIFGANGALVYKSDFQALDVEEIILVEQDSTLNLIGSDSEAIERSATLATYAWTVNGKAVEGGRQASYTADTAGIQLVALVVTDSNGKSDSQSVKLGVAPKPIEIVTELVTGPVAGAGGAGQSGDVAFDLSVGPAGVPATITSVRFIAVPPATCDVILTVTDAEGETVGSVDNTGNGEAETVNGGALPEGAYTISAGPFACAAPEGVAITVTVVYTPIVEGLDGHGDHGH